MRTFFAEGASASARATTDTGPSDLPVLTPPAWHAQAACRGVGNDKFFVEQGDINTALETKRLCDRCPVKADCLEAGLFEEHGIWGGTARTERQQIRKARGIQVEKRRDWVVELRGARTHGLVSTYQPDPRTGWPGCKCGECAEAVRALSRQRRANGTDGDTRRHAKGA